jgi:hypothetical protein
LEAALAQFFHPGYTIQCSGKQCGFVCTSLSRIITVHAILSFEFTPECGETSITWDYCEETHYHVRNQNGEIISSKILFIIIGGAVLSP